MPKHTPGPWFVTRSKWRGLFEVCSKEHVIAEVAVIKYPQGRLDDDEANAKLLGAAPDLLAALLRSMSLFIVIGNLYPNLEDMDAWQTAMAANDAAIAKAGASD